MTTAPFVEAVANTVSVRASKDMRNICQFRGMVHPSNNYSSQKLNDYKTEQSYKTELHYKTEMIYLIEHTKYEVTSSASVLLPQPQRNRMGDNDRQCISGTS